MSNSEFENLFGFDGDEENDETDTDAAQKSEADPAVVAFMDQQSAEHNAAQEQFLEHYGFTHDCRCDKDYSSGNMVEVTECYANMAVDALDACERLYAENKLLRSMISSAMGLAISEHFNIEETEGVDTGEHEVEQPELEVADQGTLFDTDK